MSESDNIELRSEKVRNIIGQIPPGIIRRGITVVLFIIIALLTGTYFFKYQYIIKTTAIVMQQKDTTFINVKIPANEIDKVKQGQKVELNFNNIPNIYNERVETEIQTIPDKIEISGKGGYYISKIEIPGKLFNEKGKELDIIEKISANAEIMTGKISFFNRMMKPFKSLVNKK